MYSIRKANADALEVSQHSFFLLVNFYTLRFSFVQGLLSTALFLMQTLQPAALRSDRYDSEGKG